MGNYCEAIREYFRFGYASSSVCPAPIIVETDNIIFSEIIAGLCLDKDKRFAFMRVLDTVFRPDGNVN